MIFDAIYLNAFTTNMQEPDQQFAIGKTRVPNDMSLTLNWTVPVNVRNSRLRSFITYWGMPAFYRFNIYSNQSDQKLVPELH